MLPQSAPVNLVTKAKRKKTFQFSISFYFTYTTVFDRLLLLTFAVYNKEKDRVFGFSYLVFLFLNVKVK